MRDLSGQIFQRILIIKPSSFGDVIHALPVLNGLRHRFPHAHISWLVSSACAGLLESHPALDEIILFDRRRFGRLGRNLAVTREFLSFLRDLRRRRFDLVLDLQGLFRSGFLAMTTGAAVRLGFTNAREFAWLFYTDRVPVRDRDMHAVDRNYLFGEPLGFDDVPVEFNLPVRHEARESAERLLADGGLDPGEPFALVGPGTRWETKRWPPGHFAEVVRRLESEHALRSVLIGMDSEREIAREVAESAGGSVVNLAGQTSLQQLIALMERAVVAVMNDSGPMHLATAMNKPMVAFYGPTSPLRTGPYRRDEAICRLDLPCSPCYLRHVAQCRYDHRCMRELSTASVLTRLARLLNEEMTVS